MVWKVKYDDIPFTNLSVPEETHLSLINCPFCGGEPSFYIDGLDLSASITCFKCKFKITREFCNEERARLKLKYTRIEIEAKLQESIIEAWNTRHFP